MWALVGQAGTSELLPAESWGCKMRPLAGPQSEVQCSMCGQGDKLCRGQPAHPNVFSLTLLLCPWSLLHMGTSLAVCPWSPHYDADHKAPTKEAKPGIPWCDRPVWHLVLVCTKPAVASGAEEPREAAGLWPAQAALPG